jgi:hypothetical protein
MQLLISPKLLPRASMPILFLTFLRRANSALLPRCERYRKLKIPASESLNQAAEITASNLPKVIPFRLSNPQRSMPSAEGWLARIRRSSSRA